MLDYTPRPALGPEWLQGPPRPDHVETPAQAAAFFASLAPGQALNLAERFPDQVGPVDGAPPAVRYRANHLLALRYLEDLQRRRRAMAGLGGTPRGMIDVPSELLRWATAPLTGHRELVDELAALDQQIAHAERFADEDRQFLRFDPSGDGLIVEVLGELASSRHIAVVIPGVGNEIANYEHGLRRSATSLYESASRSDATVIAWLGYDTPDDLLAATDSHPTEAAASLAQMLNGLDVSLDGPAHTSIIGHSYGSLVAGVALQAGARADEVAFVGSPGIGVDHVSDFGLPASIRVWAGRAASDPIQLARGLECLDLIPVCYPSAERLFFGIDPTDPSFGATRFEVGDAPSREAHSSYFRQGSRSLRNLTLIFLGQDQQVARPGS